MTRTLTDIILGTRDAQELYWAQLKVDMLAPRLHPKVLRKREADLAVQRRKFGVTDPHAYPWGPASHTWMAPASAPEPVEVD